MLMDYMYCVDPDDLYNMESDECIDCLVKYGVDYKRAEAFWQSLEWIKGE